MRASISAGPVKDVADFTKQPYQGQLKDSWVSPDTRADRVLQISEIPMTGDIDQVAVKGSPSQGVDARFREIT